MVVSTLSVEFRAGGSCGFSQTRYLHREWNRRQSRVRKYHSVPVLRLVPSDRPLFFCDKCCSANPHAPVCLWCKWTSAAAVKSFEGKTPRSRTMSMPWLRSTGLKRTTKKDGPRGPPILEKLEPRGSLDTNRSTEPPETPRSLSQDGSSPVIAAMDRWIKHSVDEATPPTAFAQSLSDPHHGGQVRNTGQRLSAVDNSRKSIISFDQSVHVPWSDGGHYESQPFFSDDESQGFRRSTDSRHSGTKSEGHVPRPARNAPRTRKAVVQSPSPAPSLNRRPLYHYIRSKETNSQSTFDCGVVPEITITPKRYITPQQGASHLAWQSTEAFPTSADELSLPTSVPPIVSLSRNGFSLSGETEQKMNLARVVHDGKFVFHESKPARKRDRIMQGLRRSFKSFFSSK